MARPFVRAGSSDSSPSELHLGAGRLPESLAEGNHVRQRPGLDESAFVRLGVENREWLQYVESGAAQS